MNYHKITPVDIANGDGCRVTFWVSGCEHHCHNCHNPETWNLESGKPFTRSDYLYLLECLDKHYIDGLTFSGGDPLHTKNRDEITNLCILVRRVFPEKSIWLYTGYLWEKVRHLPIMNYIDVLVDGKFEEEKSVLDLQYRGSLNQRVIDVKESITKGEIIYYVSDYIRRD